MSAAKFFERPSKTPMTQRPKTASKPSTPQIGTISNVKKTMKPTEKTTARQFMNQTALTTPLNTLTFLNLPEDMTSASCGVDCQEYFRRFSKSNFKADTQILKCLSNPPRDVHELITRFSSVLFGEELPWKKVISTQGLDKIVNSFDAKSVSEKNFVELYEWLEEHERDMLIK